MNKPKILFCGQMLSPFIKQDCELIQKEYSATVVDIDSIRATRGEIFSYLYKMSTFVISQIYKTDIVYIWFADYPAFPLIAVSKLFGKKCILTVGGWEVAKYPEIQYGNQLNFLRGAITRWCIRNADIVLTPSEAYRKITLECEPLANVKVIPNAIQDGLISVELPSKKSGIITALFIRNDKTSLLKGLDTFIKAVEALPYPYQILDAIPHEDLMDIFRVSKVYCQLSYTESFGITNVEAMACGCVPIVTDRDALPEIIGDCGVVVPFGDVEATKKAIEVAMTMDGNKARERAKLFTSEFRLNALRRIFDE